VEKIMKTLRLLLFDDCTRSCSGCCNKSWDLDKLERETDFAPYDEIMLTGGEPMLRPDIIVRAMIQIFKTNIRAKIILYTAKVDDLKEMARVLNLLDGLTATLHEEKDLADFINLNNFLLDEKNQHLQDRSYRLNIFKEVNMPEMNLSLWQIKNNIEWIPNCPLPINEVYKKL
jgi:hypothetical protein